MSNKIGQSEIITTVLIILLVLASIVIIWKVVENTLIPDDIEEEEMCNIVNYEERIKSIQNERHAIFEAYSNAGCSLLDKNYSIATIPLCNKLNERFRDLMIEEHGCQDELSH